MAFTRISKDAGVIAALPTKPNMGVGGLSPDQLKAKFDELGAALKTYLNETLCAELEATTGAGNIGIESSAGLEAENIQAALKELKDGLDNAVVGDIPNNSIETAKIKDLAIITAKLAELAVTTAKIADAAVTAAKISSGAVETAKIADAAVTEAKLAAAAVTNAKLGAGAVGTANLKEDLLVPLAKGGTGAATAAAARTALGAQAVINSTSATLLAADWSSKTQALTIAGMTASSKFIAAPSDATSWERAADAELYPPTAGDGTLTFTCETAPGTGEDITVTVYWW